MKRNFRFLLVCVLCTITAVVSAQSEVIKKGKVGLTATIQSQQYGLMLPIFVSETVVIAPAIDFQMAGEKGVDLGIGIMPKFYLKKGDLMPYVGVRLGAIFYFPEDGNSSTLDLLAGIAFGGDYFFNEHFSVGIEAQGNFTISDESSDRYGNPGNINFNLATMVSASIYF